MVREEHRVDVGGIRFAHFFIIGSKLLDKSLAVAHRHILNDIARALRKAEREQAVDAAFVHFNDIAVIRPFLTH